MSTIHFNQTTTLTPEQYVSGLTDFGLGRSKVFGNSADEYLKVHSKGTREADVSVQEFVRQNAGTFTASSKAA